MFWYNKAATEWEGQQFSVPWLNLAPWATVWGPQIKYCPHTN